MQQYLWYLMQEILLKGVVIPRQWILLFLFFFFNFVILLNVYLSNVKNKQSSFWSKSPQLWYVFFYILLSCHGVRDCDIDLLNITKETFDVDMWWFENLYFVCLFIACGAMLLSGSYLRKEGFLVSSSCFNKTFTQEVTQK